MRSDAKTAEEYLAGLEMDRRREVSRVRDVVLENLPGGFVEGMAYGMIAYVIPLSRYPTTYNGHPLVYVSLAAQKRYNSLYLMAAYGSSPDERFLRDAFAGAGLKLDMGKCCIRFQSADDLPLEAVGRVVGRYTPDDWIALYERIRVR